MVNVIDEPDEAWVNEKLELELKEQPAKKPYEPYVCVIDPETQKIVTNVFGGPCLEFSEFKCFARNCSKKHALPPREKVYELLKKMPYDARKKVRGVLLRFQRLFKAYIEELVRLYAEIANENELAQLISDCEFHPRLTTCYRSVVKG